MIDKIVYDFDGGGGWQISVKEGNKRWQGFRSHKFEQKEIEINNCIED